MTGSNQIRNRKRERVEKVYFMFALAAVGGAAMWTVADSALVGVVTGTGFLAYLYVAANGEGPDGDRQ